MSQGAYARDDPDDELFDQSDTADGDDASGDYADEEAASKGHAAKKPAVVKTRKLKLSKPKLKGFLSETHKILYDMKMDGKSDAELAKVWNTRENKNIQVRSIQSQILRIKRRYEAQVGADPEDDSDDGDELNEKEASDDIEFIPSRSSKAKPSNNETDAERPATNISKRKSPSQSANNKASPKKTRPIKPSAEQKGQSELTRLHSSGSKVVRDIESGSESMQTDEQILAQTLSPQGKQKEKHDRAMKLLPSQASDNGQSSSEKSSAQSHKRKSPLTKKDSSLSSTTRPTKKHKGSSQHGNATSLSGYRRLELESQGSVPTKRLGEKRAGLSPTPTGKEEISALAPPTEQAITYNTFIFNKLGAINQTLDLPQHEIASEYNRTSQIVNRAINRLFSHLDADGYMQKYHRRFAAHLTLSLREVVDLMTGLSGSPATDCFRDCLDPSASQDPKHHAYDGTTLVRAVFWALVTTRIYHKDLLRAFGVPGSQDATSESILEEGDFRSLLANLDETFAATYRYARRDFRLRALQTAKFKAKVASYAQEVLRAFENGASGLFSPTEEARGFEPADRAMFLGAIERAIVIKCRADLSHYACEWRWATMNSAFEDEWMGPEAYNSERSQAAKRNINRVCFAYSAAVITRETDDENWGGREEWETRREYVPKPAGEIIQIENDDGFNGYRKIILTSDVWTFDGALGKAGPKWTEK